MRSVFVGTGAYVGRIHDLTRLAFWPDDPTLHGFDPARLIAVDLSRTPNAAAAKTISWDAVEVDDCIQGANGNLAGTTIGPRWPEMQLVGAAYLEESVIKRLADGVRPACPPKELACRDYELKTVVYWSHIKDPRAGRRYMGHHAEILEEQGKLARVAVYKPGTSQRPDAQPTTRWIDLSSPSECDAGPESLTEIGVGKGNKKGALFLAAGRVADDAGAMPAAAPKLPVALGAAAREGELSSPKLPLAFGDPEDEAALASPKVPIALGC